MTNNEKINLLIPNDCFIGGDISLIVGALGKTYYYIGDDKKTYFKRYKEGDPMPILKKENGIIYIKPFLHEIAENPDIGFSGIIYNSKLSCNF